MREVNLETTTDTQSWFKILPLNGFNLIRVKRKLLRRRRGVYESFSSRRRSRKPFISTFRWNLANLVKFLSWNHRTSAPHRFETNGIVERAVRRIKEGTSAVSFQPGSDENGVLILWNAIAIWEMFTKLGSLFVRRQQGLFLSLYVVMKLVNQHHFLTTYIWDALNVNAIRTKLLLTSTEKCSNHDSVLRQLKISWLGETSRENSSLVS